MGEDRKELIRYLSRKNSYQRQLDKLIPILEKVLEMSNFEILDLEKMDEVIERHPFRNPDWDNELIRDFNDDDSEATSSFLYLILENAKTIILYFETYKIGILTSTSLVINNWKKFLSIDNTSIIFDPDSDHALKIEKYLNQIEFKATENGWKLY